MNKPKISIVVMAHESRSKWFPYLKKNLGDVPFSIDDSQKRLGTWGNRKQAMQMADMSADYCLIIQDDAILCKDFLSKAQEFIAKHPNQTYQFFLGKRKGTLALVEQSQTKTDGYIVSEMMYGVAIALPTSLINEAISFCDALPNDMPDDTRIKRFCLHKGLDTYYPFPSLVDHRVSPSLVLDSRVYERKAIAFIDRIEIPKIIHQIWIGPKSEPTRFTKSWKHIKGWKHMLWDEKAINTLTMKNRKLFDYYMNKGIWYGAADVARLEILEQYGGVYIDADTKLLRKWGTQPFLKTGFFAVRANTAPQKHYRVANGVMGSVKGHPIISEYISRMGKAKVVEPCWSTIGGTMLTEIIEGHLDDQDVMILEPYTFYPYNSRGYRSPNANKAIAKHYWGSTKGSYK